MTAAIFDDVFHPDDIAFGGDGLAQCLFHGLGVGAGPFAVYAGTGEPVHVALFVEEDLSRHVLTVRPCVFKQKFGRPFHQLIVGISPFSKKARGAIVSMMLTQRDA
jgi:hypothetical protein